MVSAQLKGLTSLGFLASFLLELFELLLVFGFNFKLHFGEFDLVFVLSFSDALLELRAVVAPLQKFEFIDQGLALNVLHRVEVFRHFRDTDLPCF